MRAHHFALDDDDEVKGDDLQELFVSLQRAEKSGKILHDQI